MDFDDELLVDFDSDASSLEEADVGAREADVGANDDSDEGGQSQPQCGGQGKRVANV